MKKNKKLNMGWTLIIFASFIWGLDGVLFTPKYFQYGMFDVRFIVFISHFLPCIVLSILFTNEYKKIFKFSLSDFTYFFLVALFGGTIGTLAIVKALMLSNYSLSLVTIIQKSQPIFAIILASIILKEKPKKKFYIVLVICLISLYFLIFGLNNPKLLPENNIRAGLYSLIAASSFGSSTVFGRKLIFRNSFITTTFYRMLFTTIISGILLYLGGTYQSSISAYIHSPNLKILSLAITLLTLVSISVYYKGITSTKASYATLSELFYPLSSIIIEAIVYKRILSPLQLFFAFILVTSIIYLNLERD